MSWQLSLLPVRKNGPIGAALCRGCELDLNIDRSAAGIHRPGLGPRRLRQTGPGDHPRVADLHALAAGCRTPTNHRSHRRALKDVPLQGHVGDRTPRSELDTFHAVLW